MIKVNGELENVGVWGYCVSNKPFVGCDIGKKNVESSPLETRRDLVLRFGTRAHLVLASSTLQLLLGRQDMGALCLACYNPELYLGAPRTLGIQDTNPYCW